VHQVGSIYEGLYKDARSTKHKQPSSVRPSTLSVTVHFQATFRIQCVGIYITCLLFWTSCCYVGQLEARFNKHYLSTSFTAM